MGLLVPAFLAGLAAIGIPIWVHLRHRERKEPVVFPSLMFLRKIPFREVRRQQIHHLPLFLLRVLAVLLIAFAFARPYFRRAETAAALITGGAREVVILLDRSWSMGYGDRWDRAVVAARGAVDGLTGGDRGTLIVFDEDATGVTPIGADAMALQRALDSLAPGPHTTRFAPALKAASEVLAGTDRPRREVVLITDFQRLGWPEREDVRLPAGTVLTRVDLSGGDTPDLLLAGVELRRVKDQEHQIAPAARVVNRSTERAATTVALEVNGRVAANKTTTLGPGEATLVSFDAIPLPEAASRVVLSLPGDALRADDRFHVTAARENPLNVLMVSRQPSSGGANLFLHRALELGVSPAIRVAIKTSSTVRGSDLTGVSVVILNDVPPLGGEIGRQLTEFVAAGGGLLTIVGEGTGSALGLGDVSIGRAGEVVDRVATRGGTLAAVERDHPVFEIFQAPRSGDLSSARFFRYRRIDPDGATSVLARFDDGAPAVLERALGKGRLLALAAPLDNVWSDLPVQPVFLPLLQRTIMHLASWRESPVYHTVGQVVRLEADRLASAGEDADRAVVVVSPSGHRRRIALDEGPAMLALEEPGFWEVRRTGVGGRLLTAFAVNVDLAEADLRPLDPEELAITVAPSSDSTVHAAASAVPARMVERRQRAWWYLLVGLALLLVVETFYSNRLSGIIRGAPAVR